MGFSLTKAPEVIIYELTRANVESERDYKRLLAYRGHTLVVTAQIYDAASRQLVELKVMAGGREVTLHIDVVGCSYVIRHAREEVSKTEEDKGADYTDRVRLRGL